MLSVLFSTCTYSFLIRTSGIGLFRVGKLPSASAPVQLKLLKMSGSLVIGNYLAWFGEPYKLHPSPLYKTVLLVHQHVSGEILTFDLLVIDIRLNG